MMKRLFKDVELKRKQKCIVSADEFRQKTCEMAATIWAHLHFVARNDICGRDAVRIEWAMWFIISKQKQKSNSFEPMRMKMSKQSMFVVLARRCTCNASNIV